MDVLRFHNNVNVPILRPSGSGVQNVWSHLILDPSIQ